MARINAKLRNQIRKAEKAGLGMRIVRLELLEGFYKVFARNMRDVATPVYPERFFRNVLDAFPDTSRIFGVYHRDLMIAAGIGTWFRETLEMPWASSIGDYKPLCPNNLLYWEAIRFAITMGLKKLDLAVQPRMKELTTLRNSGAQFPFSCISNVYLSLEWFALI